ncbi:MAG: caspase family protein [Bacteroidia bacterium]|nr:caspase family protein [Bacteroidia bacterium]
MRSIRKIILIQLLFVYGLLVSGQTPLVFRDTTIKGPQTFAIIMGVSRYKFVRPLAYADKDAELFRDYLKSPGGGNVSSNNIFCLLNEEASNSNFWGKGFQWLKAKNLQKGDRLFIYLAGHGDAIDEDQFFFLSFDCNPGGDKNNYLVAGAIQLYNLKKKIEKETKKGVEVFFIMDACRSNELPGGTIGQNYLNNAISEKRAGEIIMLATGAGQESLEDASIGNGHGLFTYYLVDGLSGSADSIKPDNKVSLREIQTYVDKKVPLIAQQKFKRSQDPFFCCNENSDKIISIVDTAYLEKWLQQKKRQNKGPGNAFYGSSDKIPGITQADSSLVQIYYLFNKAVKDKKLTGNASAEYYYDQMSRKYPGSPYTLDARSTLAVQFIDLAQHKVNQYIICNDELTPVQKHEYYESGVKLEKAINLVRDYDDDFANSLSGRMYFLKASGDFGKNGKDGDIAVAFQNAFAAYALDPNAPYINNRLATLHLENNNKDSAIYYARKATLTAPNWLCAFNTLAKANSLSTTGIKKPVDETKQIHKGNSNKPQFGIVTGTGASQLKPNYSVSRNDTLVSITAGNSVKLDIGLFVQINIGKKISWRPSALISFEGGELIYVKRSAAGTNTSSETLKIQTTSAIISSPFVFRFTERSTTPFVSAGPALSYVVKQNSASALKLPVNKTDLVGDIGFGIDFAFPKSSLILSPELKFSKGFIDMNKDINNFYTHSINSLKRQVFTFSVYLRGL